MENTHVLVYYGTKRKNWENRSSLTDIYIKTDGKPAKVDELKHSGIKFGVMGFKKPGEGIVFRVDTTTLHDSCYLDLGKHMMPSGLPIDDELAGKILDDAIRMNPEQADELSEYHGKISS